jgi:hypothetical protein
VGITYILLCSIHIIPSSQNLIVDLNRSSFSAQIALDMLSSTRGEEEEGGQRALRGIWIFLFLDALLLLLAWTSFSSYSLGRSETSIGEVLREFLGIKNGLSLAGGVEQRVGVRDISADERGDGAIQLGKAGDD